MCTHEIAAALISGNRRPKRLGALSINEDDEGNYTAIITMLVPKGWNKDKVDEYLGDVYPAEHCQHSYDCCGRTYGGKARWDWGPNLYMEEWTLIQIVRDYRVNI